MANRKASSKKTEATSAPLTTAELDAEMQSRCAAAEKKYGTRKVSELLSLWQRSDPDGFAAYRALSAQRARTPRPIDRDSSEWRNAYGETLATWRQELADREGAEALAAIQRRANRPLAFELLADKHPAWTPDAIDAYLDRPDVDLSALGRDGHAAPPPAETTALEQWPPDEGWHFRAGLYAFRGKQYALGGKLWKLLKHLANAKFPSTAAAMMDAMGSDAKEESSIRTDLANLRAVLRENHNLTKDSDPIPCRIKGDPSAWELRIDCPAPAMINKPKPNRKGKK